jgi:hypothetical protein
MGFVQINATSIHLFPNVAAYNSCYMNKIHSEKHYSKGLEKALYYSFMGEYFSAGRSML